LKLLAGAVTTVKQKGASISQDCATACSRIFITCWFQDVGEIILTIAWLSGEVIGKNVPAAVVQIETVVELPGS